MPIDGRIANQVRFIFDRLGVMVGYRNPENDQDVDLLAFDPGSLVWAAAPNGVNDDATIAAALADGRRFIRLRRGTYNLGTNFTGLTNKVFTADDRDSTTIKLRDNANIAAIFSCAPGANGIEFRNITFDGNRANQSSGNCQLIDLQTNAPTNFKLVDARIKNTRSSTGFGNIGCNGFEITDTEFLDNGVVDLRLENARNGRISGCYFANWNTSNTASIASVWVLQASKDIEIVRNRWLNGRAGTFCVESVPPSINSFHTGFNVSDNFMDGASMRGTGISGFFAESIFNHNRMVNGGDDAGSWAGQRNGIELWGYGNTVDGNKIHNGRIVLAKQLTPSPWQDGFDNSVVNNRIVINVATSTSVEVINVKDQADSIVSGNRIRITLSGSATLAAGIYLGFFGGSGVLTRVRCFSNSLRNTGTAAGNGIRHLSASGSVDIETHDNTITGFTNGISNQANSNETYLRVRDNFLVGNTAGVSGASTGTGYVDSGNIT